MEGPSWKEVKCASREKLNETEDGLIKEWGRREEKRMMYWAGNEGEWDVRWEKMKGLSVAGCLVCDEGGGDGRQGIQKSRAAIFNEDFDCHNSL